MKFYGEPNLLVKERVRKPFATAVTFKPLFRFNEKGEYETEDSKLIEKLKPKFKHEELIPEDTEEIAEAVPEDNSGMYSCKQCDYKTDNKGTLLAHYRVHKKGAINQ